MKGVLSMKVCRVCNGRRKKVYRPMSGVPTCFKTAHSVGDVTTKMPDCQFYMVGVWCPECDVYFWGNIVDSKALKAESEGLDELF